MKKHVKMRNRKRIVSCCCAFAFLAQVLGSSSIAVGEEQIFAFALEDEQQEEMFASLPEDAISDPEETETGIEDETELLFEDPDPGEREEFADLIFEEYPGDAPEASDFLEEDLAEEDLLPEDSTEEINEASAAGGELEIGTMKQFENVTEPFTLTLHPEETAEYRFYMYFPNQPVLNSFDVDFSVDLIYEEDEEPENLVSDLCGWDGILKDGSYNEYRETMLEGETCLLEITPPAEGVTFSLLVDTCLWDPDLMIYNSETNEEYASAVEPGEPFTIEFTPEQTGTETVGISDIYWVIMKEPWEWEKPWSMLEDIPSLVKIETGDGNASRIVIQDIKEFFRSFPLDDNEETDAGWIVCVFTDGKGAVYQTNSDLYVESGDPEEDNGSFEPWDDISYGNMLKGYRLAMKPDLNTGIAYGDVTPAEGGHYHIYNENGFGNGRVPALRVSDESGTVLLDLPERESAETKTWYHHALSADVELQAGVTYIVRLSMTVPPDNDEEADPEVIQDDTAGKEDDEEDTSFYDWYYNPAMIEVEQGTSWWYGINDGKFGHQNNQAGFGYPENYHYSLDPFEVIWGIGINETGQPFAKIMEEKHSKFIGNCFGISAATAMLRKPGSGVTLQEFDRDAQDVADLELSDRSSALEMDFLELIECLQVSQYTEPVQKILWENYCTSDPKKKTRPIGEVLEELCERVKQVPDGGDPVLINLYMNAGVGHILLGYMLEEVITEKNKKETRLLVLDSNFPGYGKKASSRYMIINTDEKTGEYTGWVYPMGIAKNEDTDWYSDDLQYGLSFLPLQAVEEIWNQRGKVINADNTMFTSGLGHFRIYNDQGVLQAEIVNGEVTICQGNVKEMLECGGNTSRETVLLKLPASGHYRIVREDVSASGEAFEAALANNDRAVKVTTDGKEMTLYAQDAAAGCQASVKVQKGQSYTMEMNVEKLGEVTLTGEGENKEVTLNISGTKTSTKNAEQAILRLNGQHDQHRFGAWEIVRRPTMHTEGLKIRKCRCGDIQTQAIPALAKDAFLKTNADSVTLKKGQKTSGLKVEMMEGDRIVSAISSKPKVAAVSIKDGIKGKLQLKGKKAGKAVVTIKLESGLSKKIQIKVQKKKVTTKCILLTTPGKVSLKRGKRLQLRAEVSPFTSSQKLTYKSLAPNVAAVSKKGVIIAKKKGKARIEIRSGKKKKTVTVTVGR